MALNIQTQVILKIKKYLETIIVIYKNVWKNLICVKRGSWVLMN